MKRYRLSVLAFRIGAPLAVVLLLSTFFSTSSIVLLTAEAGAPNVARETSAFDTKLSDDADIRLRVYLDLVRRLKTENLIANTIYISDSEQMLESVKRALGTSFECLLLTPERDKQLRSSERMDVTLLAINDVSLSGDKAEVTAVASMGYSTKGFSE